MKIGFFTYEYPIELPLGGIATYVQQIARLLVCRRHIVEVFTSSPTGGAPLDDHGVIVHRIPESEPTRFALAAGPVFEKSHKASPFDIIEGPDYNADAREAARLAPEVALVVRLHTPSIMLLELNYRERQSLFALKQAARALRLRRRVFWGYRPEHEAIVRSARAADRIEKAYALGADRICAPSRAILDQLTHRWGLDPRISTVVPYPFVPSQSLLDIPAGRGGAFVTFVGRLEVRKGIVDLARAVPAILEAYHDVRFRFVGGSDDSPEPRLSMDRYLEAVLGPACRAVEMTGPVAPSALPAILAEASVCVFPSMWENFPNVCLEGMAAGRAIVGSREGGMADMLAGGAGVLIEPGNHKQIAQAVIGLLNCSQRRDSIGRAARAKLLADYSGDRIGDLHEACYHEAIAHRRAVAQQVR